MYDELASVRGVVDLSPHEALSEAETFLTQQGYTVARRAGNSLTVERHSPDQTEGQAVPTLTVSALPQPGGGARMVIRGNDRQGLQERQDAFIEWSESLPKKPQEGAGQPEDQQRETEVPLPPVPKSETPNLPPASQPSHSYSVPPPPRQESTVWRGTKLAFGGCIVLPVLLLLGFIGCIAVLGSGGGGDSDSGSKASKSGASKGAESTVAIKEPVTVGDVTWTVTNAKQSKQLIQQGVPKQFADAKQGNFVIVDFDFINNGNEAITLDNESL